MQGLLRYFLLVPIFVFFFSVQSVSADGCYLCAEGSSDMCRDYCRFSGTDSFDTRKRCESKGCKITGTAACPTASNYKVCSALNETKTKNLIARSLR
ncbi:hypothetical protein EHQ53_08130 [Leptospira langatensis]|uniref:Uncharacterized protein n=1 Tax=Leptospira langatensis TaxID=2484983 RepID=A0A5F1ZW01_9LEPT|nr:hypothetical protein [Leptospira langatensis]TGK01397.1 hypothetical protein EHO57_10740 [Leptospira langatensis]TGL42442.1 hypothetical protein EHQ53_08130 [Leptospira langatensis]